MIVFIKGAGDLATGIAYRLKVCGFNVVMSEIEKPTTVRRTVAFSQAVFDKTTEVEGMKGVLVDSVDKINEELTKGNIPVVIDPKGEFIEKLKPQVVVDAIIGKKNCAGTKISDAPIVIAVGPGFEAGADCHCVVESQRGHYLGRTIYKGCAIPNTGVPGNIGGYTVERIIRACDDGIIEPLVSIGDYVEEGQELASVNGNYIYASISGIVRGMLEKGIRVNKGMKSGDIDPRCERHHCFTISDKARSIGGGVLEAILTLQN